MKGSFYVHKRSYFHQLPIGTFVCDWKIIRKWWEMILASLSPICRGNFTLKLSKYLSEGIDRSTEKSSRQIWEFTKF